MKIFYTRHADVRMLFREIRREWVESAITLPDKLIDVGGGKKQAIKNLKEGKISAIYSISGEKVIVITVHWGE